MPINTLQATNSTTPNPDTGGNAVTGNVNTGHAATISTVTGVGVQTKTCKWSPFPGLGGQVTSVRVKFDWTRDGALGAGCSNGWDVLAGFGLGVGESQGVFSETSVVGATSGSVDFPLTGARIRNPSSLFVADSISALGAIGQTASITISISNLRLEVVTSEQAVIFFF